MDNNGKGHEQTPMIRDSISKVISEVQSRREEQFRRTNLRQGEMEREVAESQTRHKAELVRTLAGDLGERYAPGKAVIDRFRVYHPAQQKVMSRVMEIFDNLDKLTAEGSGVIFYGSIGTGKDHLASALLYRAAGFYAIPSRWVSGLEIFSASRDSISSERKEAELIAEYTAPQILCISDPAPPRGKITEWNDQLLYRILDKRYHALRPTWATMNIKDIAEGDKMLSPPVWSRWKDNAELIPCFWPDNRKERRK